MSPIGGRRFPKAVQRRTVPDSLQSCSAPYGIGVLISTASLVTMERITRVVAFREKKRQGNHNLRWRKAKKTSEAMAAKQRKEAAAM